MCKGETLIWVSEMGNYRKLNKNNFVYVHICIFLGRESKTTIIFSHGFKKQGHLHIIAHKGAISRIV